MLDYIPNLLLPFYFFDFLCLKRKFFYKLEVRSKKRDVKIIFYIPFLSLYFLFQTKERISILLTRGGTKPYHR